MNEEELKRLFKCDYVQGVLEQEIKPIMDEMGRQFALSIIKVFQIGLQVGYNARQINFNKPN